MAKGQICFIGLGLYDEKDISIKGLEEIKGCDKVFAEFYTAKLVGSNISKLENLFGKKIQVLSRQETENAEIILNSAKNKKVCFLTAGDSMTATTHVDLRLRAIKEGIKTKVLHASSIVTAIPGLIGLQNYKFGRITTLAYAEGNYFPTSPYDLILKNKKIGLHSLILLDIQADKDRYMNANEAMQLLLDMEKKCKKGLIQQDSIIFVVARAGSDSPIVLGNTIKELIDQDFGPPLHSLVIPGKMHFMEIEAAQVLAKIPAHLGEKLQKI
jgi:diphthine synthase